MDSVELDFLNPSLRILDIGCADGALWRENKSSIFNSVRIDGVDVDSSALEKAQQLNVYNNLYTEIPTNLNQYNIVLCLGVLEHVDDYWLFLEQISSANYIILTVPNAWSLHRLFGFYAGMLDSPTSLHDGDIAIGHQIVFDPTLWQSISKMLEIEFNFKTVEIGSYAFKMLSSTQMCEFSRDQMISWDNVGADLDLCGKDYFYGAELYMVVKRND